jgi:TPR repeat protein
MIAGKAAEAESILRRLSAEGDQEATIALGALLAQTGRAIEAIEVLTPIARSGNPEAQWYLAAAYLKVVPPNASQANSWLQRAAAAGHKKALLVLQGPKGPVPDADGKVSTQELLVFNQALVKSKIATLSDQVLKCYGGSRAEIAAVMNEAVAQCFDALPSDQRVRAPASYEFSQEISRCSNQRLFAHSKKTMKELASCLPAPSK